MIQMLVAILMWALVASLLILRRGRTDRSITYAALTIAVAMTLNVNAVYLSIDPILGGTNLATLLSDGLLMIGLFFLGRATMTAGRYRPRFVRAAVGRSALAIALLGTTVTFLLIDRGSSTTTFMIDLGSQLATAIYSIIVFTYCGIVVGAMLALAGRQFWQSYGIQRIPSGLLIIGTAAAIALCVIVIVMDIAHVTGNLELMHAIDPAYGMLSLLAFLFLCAGFAGQPVIRYLRDRTRHGATREMLTEIEPIWRRATRVRPGLSSTNALHATGTDPEGRLHRKIVEIRDAMIDPRVSFAVTQPELALLEYAEQHLLGNDIHDHRPSTLAPDCPKPEAGHPS